MENPVNQHLNVILILIVDYTQHVIKEFVYVNRDMKEIYPIFVFQWDCVVEFFVQKMQFVVLMNKKEFNIVIVLKDLLGMVFIHVNQSHHNVISEIIVDFMQFVCKIIGKNEYTHPHGLKYKFLF